MLVLTIVFLKGWRLNVSVCALNLNTLANFININLSESLTADYVQTVVGVCTCLRPTVSAQCRDERTGSGDRNRWPICCQYSKEQ